MPLEASIVLLDNSEFAINSDYGHTRWDSQLDATKVIFNAKTNSNPESSVGLMTIAGNSPSVLVSPTSEYGKIAVALNAIKLHGDADVVTGINVAQLALKHRQNKNQRQRVVVFVGSPLASITAADLVKLGKKMKKNNVAVDVVSFGEDTENEEKLREFVESVNSSDNSHLVTVPAGTVLLSDMIIASPMLSEDGIVPSSGGAGAGSSRDEEGEYGVDPNLDPELAMALRMSLEEERARQAASTRISQAFPPDTAEGTESSVLQSTELTAPPLPPETVVAAASGPASAPVLSAVSPEDPVGPATLLPLVKTEGEDDDASMEGEENDDLATALALSRGEDVEMGELGDDESSRVNEEELTEEEAIARAVAMSMKEQQKE